MTKTETGLAFKLTLDEKCEDSKMYVFLYLFQGLKLYRSGLLGSTISKRSNRNRFEDSIFAQQTMLSEILKEKGVDEFDVSNLWEDYGLSKNDNRFKDLKIAPCGLVTKEKCKDFKEKVEKSHESTIRETFQEIDDESIIEAISMLLMGLEGELFEFDENQMSFYVNKLPICLANFTSNLTLIIIKKIIIDDTVIRSLDQFIKAGTQFYRVQRLIEFFKQQHKGSLVTNVS